MTILILSTQVGAYRKTHCKTPYRFLGYSQPNSRPAVFIFMPKNPHSHLMQTCTLALASLVYHTLHHSHFGNMKRNLCDFFLFFFWTLLLSRTNIAEITTATSPYSMSKNAKHLSDVTYFSICLLWLPIHLAI